MRLRRQPDSSTSRREMSLAVEGKHFRPRQLLLGRLRYLDYPLRLAANADDVPVLCRRRRAAVEIARDMAQDFRGRVRR